MRRLVFYFAALLIPACSVQAEPSPQKPPAIERVITQADPTFNAQQFLAGARQAYEMIVRAYAQGERQTLRNLLSREVYEGFDAAIRERESRGETAESRVVAIDRADITAAEVRDSVARITVRFMSKLTSVTRDRNGKVTEGSPDAITEVNELWTFARVTTSKDPNWTLIATEAAQ